MNRPRDSGLRCIRQPPDRAPRFKLGAVMTKKKHRAVQSLLLHSAHGLAGYIAFHLATDGHGTWTQFSAFVAFWVVTQVLCMVQYSMLIYKTEDAVASASAPNVSDNNCKCANCVLRRKVAAQAGGIRLR